MKVPVKDRPKLVVACGLMAVALVLTGRWVIGLDPSGAAVFEMVAPAGESAAVTHSKAVRRGSGAGKKADGFRSLDPGLRMGDLLATEALQYEGSGRDIFRVFVEIPPVKTPPEREERRPDPPKKASSLPTIPLKFFGFTWGHGARKIFLSKDEDVFIASEGDIVDRRYRIVRIAPSSVEVEDMLNSHRERILLADLGTIGKGL